LNVVVDILRNRIDSLGVAEPEIIRQGNTVVVNLPGVKDQDRAIALVGQTGKVLFRPVLAETPVGAAAAAASTTTTVPGGSTTTTVPGSGAPTTAAASSTTVATSTTVAAGATGASTTTLPPEVASQITSRDNDKPENQ